ncbi:hypothetical protein ACLKA7_006659 [Drosophila subpalustris]
MLQDYTIGGKTAEWAALLAVWHEARAERRHVDGCQRQRRPHLHLHLAWSRGVAFISYVRPSRLRVSESSQRRAEQRAA